MRLHRLEVEGFGPFRSRQVVDFDAFGDDGIFLISGRTGAGKSSILDAVCFGLYGGVPRYDGGEKRLRSDHCAPDDLSEVVVDFSTPAGRYRVTRSPEYLRPAKRGGGLTKQAAGVALEEWTTGGWIGRAARAVDVAHELEGILQLTREQFLQVILLAQNRFSEFLLAGSKDRQALLRRLFGTQRFEDIQSRFDERRRSAEQALGTRLAAVDARLDEAERLATTAELWGEAPVDGTPAEAAGGSDDGRAAGSDDGPATRPHEASATIDDRMAALERAAARADYRAERLGSERSEAERRSTEADAMLATRREEQRAQVERDRARAALARLDAEEPAIAAARTELAQARTAERLRSVLDAADRAQEALDRAVDAERAAQAAVDGLDIDADDLEQWASTRTKEIGVWETARDLEEQNDALARELADAEDAVAALTAARAEAEARRADLPHESTLLTAERDEARRVADRRDDRGAARDAAATRLAAARRAEQLSADERAAEKELAAVSAQLADAQRALAVLRQRRYDGMSGELAAALVADAPCPVCGALEHPAPAAHADPVSADDIATAEAVRDEVAESERALSGRLAELRAELAAAVTRADGRDAELAEDELRRADDVFAESVAAAERLAALEQRLQDLAAQADAIEQEHTAALTALGSARERLALLTQRVTEADALIAAARGPFTTVAERLADATAQVSAVRMLADSRAETRRRAAVRDDAVREREAALIESDFADPSVARAALLSPQAQEALESRISQHAVHREKERGILFDLELRTLPEEAIELAPVEEASRAARAEWSRAVDEAGRAAGVAERLHGLLRSAASEHERTAEAAAEFEVLQNLADTIAGRGANTRKMTLETFVLAAELEEIVAAANRRLSDMSTGRYQLQHSDALAARGAASGLGIVVFDAFTGQTRPPQSLSGGETFLTSLALALGLAEVVTARAGGIRLDTLFIDEGFGSLDGDTLDVAMRTLDELRQGGRTVGVISHVEAMQEQIPAQLSVRATPHGPSVIETR